VPAIGQKVFCVGWQKTGTKSLGLALSFLGYKVATWSPDLFYRWHEGKLEQLIERARGAQAFDDFPWLLAYREFDHAFPDAKFILTTRDSDARWLASLQKHIARNPRWVGHYLIYGSYDPIADSDRHLAVYRKHNKAVRAYFAGRSEKFLELCFERQDGWAPLCQFLGMAGVPTMPFPHVNSGERPLIARGL
jgi:hypothetical protein